MPFNPNKFTVRGVKAAEVSVGIQGESRPADTDELVGIPIELSENEDDSTIDSLEALQASEDSTRAPSSTAGHEFHSGAGPVRARMESSGDSAGNVPSEDRGSQEDSSAPGTIDASGSFNVLSAFDESVERARRLNGQYLAPYQSTIVSQMILLVKLRKEFQGRFGYAYPGGSEDLWRLVIQAAEEDSANARLFERHHALDLYKRQIDSFKLAYVNPDGTEWTDDEIAEELAQQIEEAETPDSESASESDLIVTGLGDIIDPASLANSDLFDTVGFSLDESQQNAVIGLVREGHGCLIGAAGTGKTTTTKALVRTLVLGDAANGIEPLRLKRVDIRKYHEKAKEANAKRGKKIEDDSESTRIVVPSIALVAFTGQATQVLKKNMPRGWAKNIMTIHSLLGFAPVSFVNDAGEDKTRFEPTYNKYNKMPWDRIFIDEASMVPLDLWHQMLDAMKPECRVYMIGDLNQLPPPIGVGIFGFALSKWPVFELTTVHRQSEPAANRIVETAHDILNGRMPTYDDPKTNKDWRVIGFEISGNAEKAQGQVIALCLQLAKTPVHADVDPSMPMVYQPMRDRVMTPMNGFNRDQTSAFLGQAPLNDILAEVFVDKDVPRMIIDFKKGIKRWAVGNRVMATKNEGPGVEDRVTNGLTGVITSIVDNPKWPGDRRMVGEEKQVRANRKLMMDEAHERAHMQEQIDSFSLDSISTAVDVNGVNKEEERQGGPSSHIVTVQFVNGAIREYKLNAQIEQLQLAYASTVHKTQGAEMPFAIIVVHNLQRMMLSRELLYTAVTRASQRVLILYTDMGMRIAINNQKISGRTLDEKIRQYQSLMGEDESGNPFTRVMNVRFYPDEEDIESYGYDQQRQDDDSDSLADQF